MMTRSSFNKGLSLKENIQKMCYMDIITNDIIKIGAVLADQMAFLFSPQGSDTAIISRVHTLRSHSGAARGGIKAPFGNTTDDREKRTFDKCLFRRAMHTLVHTIFTLKDRKLHASLEPVRIPLFNPEARTY